MKNFEATRTIPSDHPSLPGHFPGAPVVPGVVILDEVAATVAQWRPDARIAAVPVAKFILPLQPGQLFTIRLVAAADKGSRIDFRCCLGDRTIAEGRLEIYGGVLS